MVIRPPTDALRPTIGDRVLICPEAGVHGHGEFWLQIVSVRNALVLDHCYVTGSSIDGGPVETFYVKTSALIIKRDKR